MKQLIRCIDGFFFQKVSASGFGLMRIAWAGTALLYLVGNLPNVVRYYSHEGIIPPEAYELVFRNDHRYTLLDTFTDPMSVTLLYWILLLALFSCMIGIWTRAMTITSVLLLFSFHERNLQPLGGGDTVLRTIGLILMIAPEISSFSYDRLMQQWKHWKETGAFLKPLTTHIWPYRLLLWQLIVIYLFSVHDKFMGEMWTAGTSVAAVFHHAHFFRWPKIVMDSMTILSPLVCAMFMIWEVTWAFMLIPKKLWWVVPKKYKKVSIKQVLMTFGVVFHGGIFILMEVGSFSLAMITAYVGLLLDDDFVTFKKLFNRKWTGKIAVLFDGQCILCRRSMFSLSLMDALERLEAVDFRDTKKKKQYAPDVDEQSLDRAMHIKMPDGTYYKGFYAFRKMLPNIPALVIFTPLFYIPGVPPIGERLYAWVAARRNRCSDGVCQHIR